MKKKFNKGLSLFLTFVFLLSIFSMSSFAINIEESTIEKDITINEWDEYNKIVQMSDKELDEFGYTKEEIIEIRNFNYESEIRNRAKLDNKTLKAYGYTEKEIEELRRIASMESIPENEIKKISTATMTSKLYYISSGSRIEAGSTMYYVNLKYSWSWSKIPFLQLWIW